MAEMGMGCSPGLPPVAALTLATWKGVGTINPGRALGQEHAHGPQRLPG